MRMGERERERGRSCPTGRRESPKAEEGKGGRREYAQVEAGEGRALGLEVVGQALLHHLEHDVRLLEVG